MGTMTKTTGVALVFALGATAMAQDDDPVMSALVDELGRSMSIKLGDLQSPYFVQYSVSENASWHISATCGALVGSDDNRSRRLSTDVRVGYYDLDNTNFAGGRRGMRRGRRGRGGGGGNAMLPVDDNYIAIRQATWWATDAAYKSAVETLARKQAYMEDRNVEDRPDDFARVDEPTVAIEDKVSLEFDVQAWEHRLRALSARFLDYPHVLDSSITLTASADNRYLVNSEGTRVRQGGTGIVLAISADGQAGDGEQLSDRIMIHAETPGELPGEAELFVEVDAMAQRLTGRVESGVLEDYVGPVLFDGRAAPQLFQATLAGGVAGRPDPVGGGRRRFAGMRSLDKYLNKRILPREFSVYDDPGAEINDVFLAGRYALDVEGVEARRVDIVVDGKLRGMVMSRAPTKKFDASNGHGRGNGRASIGCLFVESSDGLDADELRRTLIEAVKDQELEYGLRVASLSSGAMSMTAMRARMRAMMSGGGGGGGPSSPLGDPVAVYKVYPDGREELVRGAEFGSFEVGTLKDIIAAGRDPIVLNTGGGGNAISVVAPAVLFEELELFTIEEEREKPPIVTAPHRR